MVNHTGKQKIQNGQNFNELLSLSFFFSYGNQKRGKVFTAFSLSVFKNIIKLRKIYNLKITFILLCSQKILQF